MARAVEFYYVYLPCLTPPLPFSLNFTGVIKWKKSHTECAIEGGLVWADSDKGSELADRQGTRSSFLKNLLAEPWSPLQFTLTVSASGFSQI